MWKAVIPKLCSSWIKTPFFYHQTIASGILPRGWQQAVGPHLLFGSNRMNALSFKDWKR